MRFSEQDIHVIPARTDVSSMHGSEAHWTQVQATPAYALTCHKAQSLTLRLAYVGLMNTFTFGTLYTIFTRTKFENNICCVGVPPKDMLIDLMRPDTDGLTLIEKKRREIEQQLVTPHWIEQETDRRIRSGEFEIAEAIKYLQGQEHADHFFPKNDPEALQRKARTVLQNHLQESLENWVRKKNTQLLSCKT